MSQWMILLIGFALLVGIGVALSLAVKLMFWLWQTIQNGFRGMAYGVVYVMGRLLRRDQGKVVIPSEKRVFLLVLLVAGSLWLTSYFLTSPVLPIVSLLMMVGAVLVLLSKIIMLQEDFKIWNGLLLEENAQFRDFQGAIPTSILIVAIAVFFMSFVFALAAFDTILPGVLFVRHSSTNILDWLISMAMQFDTVKTLVKMLSIPNLTVLQPTPVGQTFFNIALPLLFGVLLYSVMVMQYQYLQIVHQILEALRSDDANIPFLQRRAALAPAYIKKKLIEMALKDPEPRVRRRAMSVARHAPIFTFPQAFLGNLHQEQNDDLKDWGLKICHDLLEEYMATYDPKKLEGIVRSIRHQRYKRTVAHNTKTHRSLVELEQMLQAHLQTIRRGPGQHNQHQPPQNNGQKSLDFSVRGWIILLCVLCLFTFIVLAFLAKIF